MSVVIETTKGIFTVDLYTQHRPKTCKNFLKLCKVKYYNYSLFHSVQSNFIAQTGDPTGQGKNGGESIYRRLYGDQATYYEGELIPKMKHTKKGTLSMVTIGNNLFGSQFFITLDENLDYLDAGNHCVFGEIVEGLDEIVQMFNEVICDGDHRPYQDIRITHTVVLDDPFEDPAGLEIPDRSPEPTREMLSSTRIGADEDIDDYEGMTEKEIAEMMADREARAQATILEMIGDLPEADVAPPENVLFVCKLNPVTTDDDLEIIFSRFGKVKSCEVIRDRKTNDSLQYAFVEFEDAKCCEAAYFKMDNVLIDDRRIHVDFSQSVSKYRWKGKGRLEILDEKPKSSNFDKERNYQNRDSYKNTNTDRYRDHSSNGGRDRYKDQKEKDRQMNYSRGQKGRYDEDSRDQKRDNYRDDSREQKLKDRHRDDSNERRPKDRHRDHSNERRPKDRHRDHSNERKPKDRHRPDSNERKPKDRHRDDSNERRPKDRHRDDSNERRPKDRHRDDSNERRPKDRHRDDSNERRPKDRYSDDSNDRRPKDRHRDHSNERRPKDCHRDDSNERRPKDRHRDDSNERKPKDRHRDDNNDPKYDDRSDEREASKKKNKSSKKKKKSAKSDDSSDSDHYERVSKTKHKRRKSRSNSVERHQKKKYKNH